LFKYYILINPIPEELRNKNYKIDTYNKKEAYWLRIENSEDIMEWYTNLSESNQKSI